MVSFGLRTFIRSCITRIRRNSTSHFPPPTVPAPSSPKLDKKRRSKVSGSQISAPTFVSSSAILSITPPTMASPIPIPTKSLTYPPPAPSTLRRTTTTPQSSLPRNFYPNTPTPLSPTSTSAYPTSPTSPPILLRLPPPTALDLLTICNQIGYIHDQFLNHVTATTLSHTCAKILQKNLMFKMSDEAITIAGEFASLIHTYLNTIELGQRTDPNWSLQKSSRFKKVCAHTGRQTSLIFGERLGNRLDTGKLWQPIYSPSSRFKSVPGDQGIPLETDAALVKGIEYEIEDWNKAIQTFIAEFDPYRPPSAVKLMLVTANKLKKAAKGVIKIVEYHYRIALDLRPIEGVSEAELVHRAIVKEHGTDLGEVIRKGFLDVEWDTEKMWRLVGGKGKQVEGEAGGSGTRRHGRFGQRGATV